jgi:hypoxia up-regulated 1
MANLTERGAVDPVVKLQVGLSESGMAVIHDAFVYGEVKDESIAGKIKGFFGGSSSTTSTEEDTETASESVVSPTSSGENAEPTEVKLTPNNIPLDINFKYLTVIPYTTEEVSAARKRLRAVDQAEKLRAKTGEARNMLEGYLYRLRDLLDGDEMTPFMLYSKPEERAKLETKFKEAMAWFHDDAEDADMAALWSRRDEME